jgi:hypothetical protein
MVKKILYLLILCLLSTQLAAQEEGTRVNYGDLYFTIPPSLPQNINILNFAGDPVDLMYPGGPQPPHIEFMLYDESPAPQYPWEAKAAIWLYRTTDITAYEFHQNEVQRLQDLLSQSPDLHSYEVFDATGTFSLPFLPTANAVQVLRSHSQYVDNCVLKGLSYVTLYSQGVSPFLATDFFYTFQGISVDGQYYVSLRIPLNASMFPSEIAADFNYDELATNYEAYVASSIETLNAASPDAFSPSLSLLDEFIASINFGGSITECF